MKFVSGDVGKLQWVALLTVVLIAIAIAAGIWSARSSRSSTAISKTFSEP